MKNPMKRATLPLLLLFLAATGCASAKARSSEEIFADFLRVSKMPLTTVEDGWVASRITDELTSAHALDRMSRLEVMHAIGRGDDCVNHRDCGEHGFLDNDWHYTVGQVTADFPGTVPVLIVGFDRFGDVDRVWNLRTHSSP